VARIFLCHASEDKAQVREVYHRLRAIDGLEPWLDEEGVFRPTPQKGSFQQDAPLIDLLYVST
jgi:hypothetical protein